MSFTLHRPDCPKATKSPDDRMLKKLLRDRKCRPVLRGILESLLQYLTQVLPKWTTNDRSIGRPGPEAEVQSNTRPPVQRTALSKDQPRVEPAIVHSTPEDGQAGGRAGDCTPRRLTTFQLLQSKFKWSTPKPPITHPREVGKLNCSRGGADLKGSQCSEPSVRKSHSRREHGSKKAATVKDIVAKFAVAEQKEQKESLAKKQPIRAARLVARGTVLSTLMEKFEDMVTVRKGGGFKSSYGSISQGVKATNKEKHKVNDHKRQQQQKCDQPAGKLEAHEQVKGESEEVGMKVSSSAKREEHTPMHAEETSTKANTDRKENKVEIKNIEHVTESDFNQKDDSKCLSLLVKPQSFEKGMKRWIPKPGIMKNTLNCEHQELFSLESVIDNMLPELCRAPVQLEGQLEVHVGTITSCSPLWSKCVDSCPKLHSEKTSGGLCKDCDNGFPSNTQTIRRAQVEDIKPTKTKTIPRQLPKFLIPRVQRFGRQTDFLHRSESNFGDVNPSAAVRQLHADKSQTALNMGMVDQPPSDLTETAFQTIQRDRTEFTPQDKERTAEEQQPIVSTDIPHSSGFSEGTENKATYEDRNTSDATSPKMNPDTHIQRWRPKYTSITYGDPSVKQTYKPKTIRFTDTFTF